MYIRWAMKISLVAPVKHSQPYLENDLAPPLDLHYLRISPWLWFSVKTPNAGVVLITIAPEQATRLLQGFNAVGTVFDITAPRASVERDMNGARGALLRALVDTPALEDCVGCLASNVVDVRWRKGTGVRQPGSGATRRICSCTPRSSQFCSRSQAKEAHRGQPSGGLLLSSSFFIANIIW